MLMVFHASSQTCWFLSCPSGRIMQVKPIYKMLVNTSPQVTGGGGLTCQWECLLQAGEIRLWRKQKHLRQNIWRICIQNKTYWSSMYNQKKGFGGERPRLWSQKFPTVKLLPLWVCLSNGFRHIQHWYIINETNSDEKPLAPFYINVIFLMKLHICN